MVHQIIRAVGLLLLIGSFSSCYYDNRTELYPGSGVCDTTQTGFTAFVNPIITQQCASCHSGSSPVGVVPLNNYAEIAASAKSGKLYGSLHRDPGFQPMPQGGNKWSDCDLQKLKKWIDKGALND